MTEKNSITKNQINMFEINRDQNYKLLTIPPNIWYGFSCLGSIRSLIVNCCYHPHNPKKYSFSDIKNDVIPFNW